MSKPEKLPGDAILYCGDCIQSLKLLRSNSIDAVVTDPPYHLTSIVKRFANANAKNEEYALNKSHSGYMSRGFMGKVWDGGDIAFQVELWEEVYRAMKPGAHLLSFGGTRTYHRMACAIEDAGFEIRDCVSWNYATGFPKSQNVSKVIDKKLGVKRDKVKTTRIKNPPNLVGGVNKGDDRPWRQKAIEQGYHEIDSDDAISDDAKEWDGWGTALKPAMELICLARKPLSEKTVAANVLKWGTGALNIDSCRISTSQDASYNSHVDNTFGTCLLHEVCQKIRKQGISDEALFERLHADNGRHYSNVSGYARKNQQSPNSQGNYQTCRHCGDELVHSVKEVVQLLSQPRLDVHTVLGRCTKREYILSHLSNSYKDSTSNIKSMSRWPANVILDGSEEVVNAFPDLGISAGGRIGNAGGGNVKNLPTGVFQKGNPGFGDSGSASRFFYNAKSDSDDRFGSKHPTVKPVDLMQYLVRLITPPGGTVLDPFAGSGTTGEAAFRERVCSILMEREKEYQDDIRRRMKFAMKNQDDRRHEIAKVTGVLAKEMKQFHDTWLHGAEAVTKNVEGTKVNLPMKTAEGKNNEPN